MGKKRLHSNGGNSIPKPIVGMDKISSKNWIRLVPLESSYLEEEKDMQSLDSGNLYAASNFVFYLKGKWVYPKITDNGNNTMMCGFGVITQAVVRKMDWGFVCVNVEGQYGCDWDSLARSSVIAWAKVVTTVALERN